MSSIAMCDRSQSQFDYSLFKLKPTGQMRLLRILPGTDYPIRCVITVHDREENSNLAEFIVHSSKQAVYWINRLEYDDLKTALHLYLNDPIKNYGGYICLSYQWSRKTDSDKMHIIQLSGQSFRVRTNLFNFLVKARQRLHSTPIWIDAVCVNQNDIDERNDQVKAMSTIYRRAQCVIVWLGSFELSTSDMLWIQKCQRHIKAKYEELITVLKAHSNEYWNRAWITQEVLLASSCLVWLNITAPQWPGLSETLSDLKPMTLERFEGLYKQCMKKSQSSVKGVLNLLATRFTTLIRISQAQELNLLREIIGQHKLADCTEVVDRIYALRSLCREGNDIEVNYRSTRWELFCQVMWACQESLCLCLVLHLLDTLQLREELELKCSFAGTLSSVSLSNNIPISQLTRRYISVTTARSVSLIHGPGLPRTKSTIDDLIKMFQQYPKSRALRTCDCTHAFAHSWLPKQDISLCAKLLCQGYAFEDVHIFFENRQGLFQATGVLTDHHDQYVLDGLPGVLLNSKIGRSHRLTMTLTLLGLLQVMYFMPKQAQAKHPTRGKRPAQYEILHRHAWRSAKIQANFLNRGHETFERSHDFMESLLYKLGMPPQPQPMFMLCLQISGKQGPESLYGSITQESLAINVRNDCLIRRIHQPRSRAQRKRPVANSRSSGRPGEAV